MTFESKLQAAKEAGKRLLLFHDRAHVKLVFRDPHPMTALSLRLHRNLALCARLRSWRFREAMLQMYEVLLDTCGRAIPAVVSSSASGADSKCSLHAALLPPVVAMRVIIGIEEHVSKQLKRLPVPPGTGDTKWTVQCEIRYLALISFAKEFMSSSSSS